MKKIQLAKAISGIFLLCLFITFSHAQSTASTVGKKPENSFGFWFANRHLSNLTASTSVNVDLVPASIKKNLGSLSLPWKNLYVGEGIYLDSGLFISNKGNSNTAIGYNALYSNTSGNQNTAIGYKSLALNTTGSNNTAIGAGVLTNNITGNENIGIGTNAMFSNNSGYFNIAFGNDALYSNISGHGNIANGWLTLYSNTYGIGNIATGYASLELNTTGGYNTATGVAALSDNIKGSNNTAYGEFTLGLNHNGDYNTAIGAYANVNAFNLNNSTALGVFALVTASHQVRIGDEAITSIGGYVDWTNISDQRVKKNIKSNVPGLAFINKLKPVTYNLDLEASDRIIQAPEIKNTKGKIIQFTAEQLQEQLNARKQKEQVVYTGFVAQEVEKAAKELNYDFSGVDAAKNDKDLYGLRYSQFVVPLVKAVQELSAQNEELKKELADLKTIVMQLKNGSIVKEPFSSATLQQNVPNPFGTTTTISYNLPGSINKAAIQIASVNGQIIKTFPLTTKGSGQLTLRLQEFASGTYTYTLIADGKMVDSKKMVVAK